MFSCLHSFECIALCYRKYILMSSTVQKIKILTQPCRYNKIINEKILVEENERFEAASIWRYCSVTFWSFFDFNLPWGAQTTLPQVPFIVFCHHWCNVTDPFGHQLNPLRLQEKKSCSSKNLIVLWIYFVIVLKTWLLNISKNISFLKGVWEIVIYSFILYLNSNLIMH